MEKLDKGVIESLDSRNSSSSLGDYSFKIIDSSSCYQNIQAGNCGIKCPVLLLGECPIEDEIKERYIDDWDGLGIGTDK